MMFRLVDLGAVLNPGGEFKDTCNAQSHGQSDQLNFMVRPLFSGISLVRFQRTGCFV